MSEQTRTPDVLLKLYRGSVAYQPASPSDPIPWIARLYDRNADGSAGQCLDSKWRGSREEAIEAIHEMIFALASAQDEEFVL